MDFSYISQRLIEHTALGMGKYHYIPKFPISRFVISKFGCIQKLEGLRYRRNEHEKKFFFKKTLSHKNMSFLIRQIGMANFEAFC